MRLRIALPELREMKCERLYFSREALSECDASASLFSMTKEKLFRADR
jgi:hypothetical protein